ncbi:nucleotidyltransferase domain-containing protein [Candidatus Poriferisocius sp.]|uniref:nucleotidyltransferase domain-containing protein n=1 Tax=Candidatus Poriferisocius sp. TaxID=3101276 RepID=UPI003B0176D8
MTAPDHLSPSVGDARRAAERISRVLDPAEVLVFGSVARGCATAGSDVDLVVMFDDLGDYTQRRELAHQARTAAEQAAGFACDVRVTDRAEWRVRTTQCRSSFEAHIASCAITLMSRPPKSPIDWDKKIGKPATDEQQAVAILAKTTHSLITILAYLRPSPSEADALAEDDTDLAHQMQHSRLLSVCEHAQIAMETSLQALICTRRAPHPENARSIWGLIDAARRHLDPAQAALIDATLGPLTPDQISIWRHTSTYPAIPLPGADPNAATPEFAAQMAAAAVQLAATAISLIEQALDHQPAQAQQALRRCASIEQQLPAQGREGREHPLRG